jgi:propionyl-CoA carboxylase alpha chain/3-methylcrotonyl-CoA carboxylase alpha subunit
MIAKLIAWAPDRAAAATALADACRAVEVWPVRTNAAFLARCLDHPDFLAGEVDTGFIPGRLEALTSRPEPSTAVVAAAAQGVAARTRRVSPGRPAEPFAARGLLGFRLNGAPGAKVRLQSGDRIWEAAIAPADDNWRPWAIRVGDDQFAVGYGDIDGIPVQGRPNVPAFYLEDSVILFENGETYAFSEPDYAQAHAGAASDGAVTAPMPGRIVSVEAVRGQSVSKGAKLVTLEAMKMEHGLTAPFDGVVAEVNAVAGGQVSEGTVLVRLEPST